jgi:hypothetical protein
MALTDRELLAKTLQAEAGNQGIGGMLAVGSVIRNRMGQGGSLSDVILAPAQFSAWNKVTGAVGGEQGQDMAALKPSEDAYAAADAILSGNAPDITGGATHYYNPSISNPAWGREKAGGDWTKIGAHIFGKAGDFRTGAAKMNGEQTQKPQGLLGGLLGGQGIGGALGMSDDFRDKLKMAILAGTGDPRMDPLIRATQAQMQERRGEAKEQRQRNKSIEFLQKRADAGDEIAANILGAVSTGVLPVGTGVSTYLTQQLEVPKDTRTQRQKDYEYASTVLKLPQDQAIQWAKSGTTVNVGGDADDFSKALMKEQAKRYETYQDAAGSARSVMENLDIMSSIVSQDDFYSGFGAETLNKAKRAAIAFGADPEGVKNAETFIKIAKDSALQAMGGSLGVGFSNADREFVEAMVPNIANTVEGNKLIIETQKRIQNRKIELAMFAEQYAANNGNLSGFTAAVKDWAAENPLFTEDEKQQLFGGAGGGGASGLSDEASSFLKKP